MPAIPAVIGAAVGIGGSILSANAQKSAINKATDAQQQSSAQQMALLKQLYQTNTQNETPYMNAGYGALSVQEQLLGLKPMTAQQFNDGTGWYQPGTVNYAPPSTPSTGTGGTGTGGSGTPSTPVQVYHGPSMSAIQAMQHDGVKGNYKSALAAYNSWQASHPNDPMDGSQPITNPTGSTGATQFPATPAGIPTTPPASVTGSSALSGTTTNPIAVAQHAQQAIQAGADPQMVAARMQQMGIRL